MRLFITALCTTGLFACSPYKKVTLTKSDQLTTHWKDASEASVLTTMGPLYKSKAPQGDGYVIRYDYSYAKVTPPEKSNNGIQVRATYAPQRANSITARPDNLNTTVPRLSGEDSVIRYIDFYFLKSQHVQAVYAVGYADSVYYVKRK